MFNNSAKIMFFFIVLTSTMMVVSANSWLAAWMGLEINLLSFIPLMSDNNMMSTEASLKYFLVQSLASLVLLFSVMTSMTKNMLTFQSETESTINMMIMSSLLMKSGAAPFHFWFPNVLQGLSWNNSLIMMTWQKIAPMMLMTYIMSTYLTVTAIISSAIIGAVGGLNQTSLRKLMAYSSINHLSWMLAALNSSETMWWMYFMFYSLLSVILLFMFNMSKIYHLNQLFTAFNSSKTLKFTMFFNFLSLGGLPPFIGFFPKWVVMQSLINESQMFMLTIMIMMTLITLFFYLRMTYTAFMMNSEEMTWNTSMNLKPMNIKIYMLLSFISIFGLAFVPVFYIML